MTSFLGSHMIPNLSLAGTASSFKYCTMFEAEISGVVPNLAINRMMKGMLGSCMVLVFVVPTHTAAIEIGRSCQRLAASWMNMKVRLWDPKIAFQKLNFVLSNCKSSRSGTMKDGAAPER